MYSCMTEGKRWSLTDQLSAKFTVTGFPTGRIHKWVQGVNITISETRKSFATLARLLHLEAVVQGGEFSRQCKATSEEMDLEAPTVLRGLNISERRRMGGRMVPVTELTSRRTSCLSIGISFKLLSMRSKNVSMWTRLLWP